MERQVATSDSGRQLFERAVNREAPDPALYLYLHTEDVPNRDELVVEAVERIIRHRIALCTGTKAYAEAHASGPETAMEYLESHVEDEGTANYMARMAVALAQQDTRYWNVVDSNQSYCSNCRKAKHRSNFPSTDAPNCTKCSSLVCSHCNTRQESWEEFDGGVYKTCRTCRATAYETEMARIRADPERYEAYKENVRNAARRRRARIRQGPDVDREGNRLCGRCLQYRSEPYFEYPARYTVQKRNAHGEYTATYERPGPFWDTCSICRDKGVPPTEEE